MILQAFNVWKTFGRFDAVRDLSFSVPEGSTFALVGPNGAGKTTTIKVLMNITQPTRGNLNVLGVDSCKLSAPEFAQIGYVSEQQGDARSNVGKSVLKLYTAFLSELGSGA